MARSKSLRAISTDGLSEVIAVAMRPGTVCSISQIIQTTAVPRLTTTPRNTNVKAGTVSMFSIPDAMQAAYQQTKRDLGE